MLDTSIEVENAEQNERDRTTKRSSGAMDLL